MGWTSYHAKFYKNGTVDRKKEIDKLWTQQESEKYPELNVLKSRMVDSTYYAAIEEKENGVTKQVFAVVVLTSINMKDYFNFSYKDMCESAGPYCYDCPRVIGILMPQGIQSDIGYAQELCAELDIENYTINIESAYKAIRTQVKETLNGHWSQQSAINLPARLRMSILYAYAQTLNGRVANTCNLSENWVGYATRYGDSAGDFSPLANFTVEEVKAIGRELGLNELLIEKVPTDGLCGKTDEDNLGFTYAVLDRYIRTGKIDDLETKKKIDYLHEKNAFKLRAMPIFEYKIAA